MPLYMVPGERLEYTYVINYDTHPRRGKTVHILIKALDGHAAFVTLLRLDSNFTMASRARRPDLDRAKSAPGFMAETGKPATRPL